jgi:hypothetical protein
MLDKAASSLHVVPTPIPTVAGKFVVGKLVCKWTLGLSGVVIVFDPGTKPGNTEGSGATTVMVTVCVAVSLLTALDATSAKENAPAFVGETLLKLQVLTPPTVARVFHVMPKLAFDETVVGSDPRNSRVVFVIGMLVKTLFTEPLVMT